MVGRSKRRRRKYTYTEKKELENVDVMDESYFVDKTSKDKNVKIKFEDVKFEDGDIVIIDYQSFCEVDEFAENTIQIQKKELLDKNRHRDTRIILAADYTMATTNRMDNQITCVETKDRKKMVFEVTKDDDNASISNQQILGFINNHVWLFIVNIFSFFPFFLFIRKENKVKEYICVVKKVIYKKGDYNKMKNGNINSDFIQQQDVNVNDYSEKNSMNEMQNINVNDIKIMEEQESNEPIY